MMSTSAIIICTHSWNQTWVEHGADPATLAPDLLEIIRRDGAEKACIELSRYDTWAVINAKSDHDPDWLWSENESGKKTVVVDGYGLAYEDSCAKGEPLSPEFSFGILSDGVLRIVHSGNGLDVCVDPFADDAEEKLALYVAELEDAELDI